MSQAKEFVRPSYRFRPVAFWALNGELKEPELLRQLQEFKSAGLGGVCLHARSGLRTRYLSPHWFRLMRFCVERARELKLRVWLYDEDRYPSGAAGGLVTRHPAFRQKRLWMEVNKSSGQENNEPIASFALRRSLARPLSYRRLLEPSKLRPGELLLSFRVQPAPLNSWYNGQTYLDTMSKPAVRAFVRATHERYRRTWGRHLRQSVEGIFTDEPNRGPALTSFWGEFIDGYADVEPLEIPWTDRLTDHFKSRNGYDLLDHLPELYLDIRDRDAAATRYHYYDTTTSMFVDAFGKTISRWCEKHGTQLLGHVLGEEPASVQTSLVGAAMRFYPPSAHAGRRRSGH